MTETPAPPNEAFERAKRLGLGGIGVLCLGILWAVFSPGDVMFGAAELLTLMGMLMILTAAWKAADAANDADPG